MMIADLVICQTPPSITFLHCFTTLWILYFVRIRRSSCSTFKVLQEQLTFKKYLKQNVRLEFCQVKLLPTSFSSDIIHCLDVFYALLLLQHSQVFWQKLRRRGGKKIQSRPQDYSFSVVTKLQMELSKTCSRKLVEIKLDQWEKVTLSSECQILSYRKCFKASRSNLRSW